MLPKIQSTVDAREAQIAADLAAAEQARAEADETEEAYRLRMDQSRGEAMKLTAAAKQTERRGDREVVPPRPMPPTRPSSRKPKRVSVRRARRRARDIEKVAAEMTQDIVKKVAGLSVGRDEAAAAVKIGGDSWLSPSHMPAPRFRHEAHAPPTAWGLGPTGWVALALIVVYAILIWKKVPAAIAKSLDAKIAAIREQLDEAAALRQEAEALKAEYQAKAGAAEAEAAAMIERAHGEARGDHRQGQC